MSADGEQHVASLVRCPCIDDPQSTCIMIWNPDTHAQRPMCLLCGTLQRVPGSIPREIDTLFRLGGKKAVIKAAVAQPSWWPEIMARLKMV